MEDNGLMCSHAKHLEYVRDSRFFTVVRDVETAYVEELIKYRRKILETQFSGSERKVQRGLMSEGVPHSDIPLTGENVRLEYPPPIENDPLFDKIHEMRRNSEDILKSYQKLREYYDLLGKLKAILAVVPLELAAREHNAIFSEDFYRKLAEKDNVFDPDFALRVAEVLRKHNPPVDRVYSALDKLADHVSPSARAEDLLRRFEELIKG